MSEKPDFGELRILGLYSPMEQSTLGAGLTAQRRENLSLWFVVQLTARRCQLQPLGSLDVPAGPKKMLALDELAAKYKPEPIYYLENLFPIVVRLHNKIKDQTSLSVSGLDPAEKQLFKAMQVSVDKKVAAGKRPDKLQTAKYLLNYAVEMDQEITDRQRQEINSLGINERKNANYNKAVETYLRALALSGKDENLLFNLARAFYEMGDLQGCKKYLEDALRLNPKFEEAWEFVRWLRKKKDKQGSLK